MTSTVLESLEYADENLTGIDGDELDPDQYHLLKDVVAKIHVLHDSVEASHDPDAERVDAARPIGGRVVADGGHGGRGGGV